MSRLPADSDPPPPLPELDRLRPYLRILAEAALSRRLHAKVDASDIVQQTMLDAYRSRQRFEGQSDDELKAWLRQILINNILGVARDFRAQKRDIRREQVLAEQLDQSALRLENFLAADQSSPSLCLQRSERVDRLTQALADLPDDQRRAVVLKHLEGRSLAEVATAMDRSVVAVGGLLKRGMSRLRRIMEELP